MGVRGGAGVNRVYGGIGGWLYGSAGAPTSVNVPVLTIPISAVGLKFMLAGQTYGHADGISGIGPNATAPGPSSVTTALPAISTKVCSSTNPRVTCSSVPIRYPAESRCRRAVHHPGRLDQ
jgi:hypothetical protein